MGKVLSDRELLIELMRTKGWKQTQLAERLYIQQSNVSKVVNGKQNLSHAVRNVAENLLTEEEEKRLDQIIGVKKYTPNEKKNAVAEVFKTIWDECVTPQSVRKIKNIFNSFFYFLEKNVNLFNDEVMLQKEIREKFKIIRTFLELGGDSKAIQSYEFCMRIHNLATKRQKFIFMEMIVKAFQNSPSEAIEKFSELEEQMVNQYIASQ